MEKIKEAKSLEDAIWQMVVDVYGKELSDDEIKELTGNMSLSTILALNDAWTAGNDDAVKRAFVDAGKSNILEYSMPGRAGVQSAASQRVLATKKPAPQRITQPTQPDAPNNHIATKDKQGANASANAAAKKQAAAAQAADASLIAQTSAQTSAQTAADILKGAA
jgi:branched-subunit amino acid aminotransferase/4-amino-4-deoxychorismate lyase